MDDEKISSGEALLRAWLSLAATLDDRRLVSGLTYNEAVVCNYLLYQQKSEPEQPLTATILCEKTRLLKSQMNQLLSSLEARGYVSRRRSQADRRQVEIRLTEAGKTAYIASHAEAAAILSDLVDRMGVDAIEALTAQVAQIDAAIRDIRDDRQKGLP